MKKIAATTTTTTTTTTPNILRANSRKNTDYKTQPVTYAFMFLQREKTKQQYAGRLKLFFNFHQFPGASLDEQGQYFLERARQDIQ